MIYLGLILVHHKNLAFKLDCVNIFFFFVIPDVCHNNWWRHSTPNDLHLLIPWRSWNDFHNCANAAMSGCPREAAIVWESLRQESRKAEFSGNLYNMCASLTTLAPSTVPAPQTPPTSDQTNQETLKGRTYQWVPSLTTMIFPTCSTLLVLFMN